MKTFIWVFAIFLVWDVFSRILWLVKVIPKRTKEEVAVDTIINFAVLTWAVVLLAQ